VPGAAAAAGGGDPARRHGGLLLVDLLIAHGVRHVFGLPGGQTMALYDGILERAPSIRHLLVRDERSGAYAADAYARVTGAVGVCDATVGPGAAKLPSGLGEALNASVPVLALVSDLPRELAPMRYRGAASQALDQARLLEPVTKWLASVDDPAAMPGLVRRAFREATGGRPGPVALLLPQDVLDAPWPEGTARVRPGPADARFGRCPPLRPRPDPADVDAAAGVLRAARRPLLLAGGGVLLSGAGEALRALAERLSAGVATTLSGKGAFPETHPLSVGSSARWGRRRRPARSPRPTRSCWWAPRRAAARPSAGRCRAPTRPSSSSTSTPPSWGAPSRRGPRCWPTPAPAWRP
jgi:acetolactate synthase I/II/III large subunit